MSYTARLNIRSCDPRNYENIWHSEKSISLIERLNMVRKSGRKEEIDSIVGKSFEIAVTRSVKSDEQWKNNDV